MTEPTITCRECGEDKPESEIVWTDSGRTQKSDICRPCRTLEVSRRNLRKGQQARAHAHIGYEENEAWHLMRGYEVLRKPLGRPYGN